MAKSNLVTIESVILALTGATKENPVSSRTAAEILVEIRKVFPTAETSKKSIYSTVCKNNISMPGSNRSAINEKAFDELMSRLKAERAPQVKTGTDDKSAK